MRSFTFICASVVCCGDDAEHGARRWVGVAGHDCLCRPCSLLDLALWMGTLWTCGLQEILAEKEKRRAEREAARLAAEEEAARLVPPPPPQLMPKHPKRGGWPL